MLQRTSSSSENSLKKHAFYSGVPYKSPMNLRISSKNVGVCSTLSALPWFSARLLERSWFANMKGIAESSGMRIKNISSLCYSHLIQSHFEYGKQCVNITSKRVDFQLYPLFWSDRPQIPPPPQTPVSFSHNGYFCETTVFKAIWDYHQNGYWQTLWSSSLLWQLYSFYGAGQW